MSIHLLIVVSAVATIVLFAAALFASVIFDEIMIDGIELLPRILIVFTVVSLLVTVLSIFAYIPLDDAEWKSDLEPTRTEYITALVDSNQTSGRMYLMSGYVREDLYYQYMTKTADGGCEYRKIIASDATIYSARSNYRVEQYRQRKTWLFIYDERTVYKVFIPDGSTISNYNIDLQ